MSDAKDLPVPHPGLNRLWLRWRRRSEERMDDPGLNAAAHVGALRGLSRLNRLSRTAESLWKELARCSASLGGRPLKVLDLACGGGDITRRLARLAARSGAPVRFAGCDRSPRAVEYAIQRTGRQQLCASFFVLDVLRDPLPEDFDFFVSSLFLHHLDEQEAVRLLFNMGRAARCGLVLNDLERSLIGFVLAGMASRLFSRSPVVHSDALLSVRAAFTIGEVSTLAESAGLRGFRLTRCWPRRILLSWSREHTHAP